MPRSRPHKDGAQRALDHLGGAQSALDFLERPILGTTIWAILGILGLILGILGGAKSALD